MVTWFLDRIPAIPKGFSLFLIHMSWTPPELLPPLVILSPLPEPLVAYLPSIARTCSWRWTDLLRLQPASCPLQKRGREEKEKGGEAGPLRDVESFSALLSGIPAVLLLLEITTSLAITTCSLQSQSDHTLLPWDSERDWGFRKL